MGFIIYVFYFNMKKIAIVGTHGVGKSKICEKILTKIWCTEQYYSNFDINEYKYFGGNINIMQEVELIGDIANLAFISEQFREVVKNIYKFEKQTEDITLATYAKQLYLENLYTAQGKNILCDRSILDTFIYFRYLQNQIKTEEIDLSYFSWEEMGMCNLSYCENSAIYQIGATYSKIYLIEPSDREIEDDGFRLTDKKQQLEIHKLFLEYFKDFNNVEIVNQEDVNKKEFIEIVANEFIL